MVDVDQPARAQEAVGGVKDRLGIEEMEAEPVDAEGGGGRRHDDGQRRRRFHPRQLTGEAAQALQLAPGGRVELDAGHQGDDVIGMGLHRRQRGRHPAPAEDDDAIGELEDLLGAVGDEEDGRPPPSQFPHQVGHPAGGGDPERGGGLVENEEGGGGQHGSGDGHQLAFTARERFDRLAHVPEFDAEAGQHPVGLGLHLLLGQQRPFPAEEQVGHDVEVVAQGEVLPDDGQARRAGTEPDGAGIGLDHAGDALDEGRLARAVLAHQGDDLAGGDVEIDTVEDRLIGETLRQAGDRQERRQAGGGAGDAARLAMPPSRRGELRSWPAQGRPTRNRCWREAASTVAATSSTPPVTMNLTEEDTASRSMPLAIDPMTSAPSSADQADPRPPNRLSSSIPDPIVLLTSIS